MDGRYVEISLAGGLLTDVAVDLPGGRPLSANIGFALTEEGDAFLSAPYAESFPVKASSIELVGIYVLDKTARAWKPVHLRRTTAGQPAQNGFGYVYGVDGKNLVLASGKLIKFYNIVD